MSALQGKKVFPAPILENIPNEIKAPEVRRWIVWKLTEVKDTKGKAALRKLPYQAKNGYLAKADDPKTWCSYAEALKAYQDKIVLTFTEKGKAPVKLQGGPSGIGFQLGYEESTGKNYFGVDLDGLLTPEKWKWANEIIKALDSYAEISPSGKGVHVLGNGKKGPDQIGVNNRREGVEVYDQRHYFTVSGNHIEGTPLTLNDREEQLRAFHATIWRPKDNHKEKRRMNDEERAERLGSPQVVNPTEPPVSPSPLVALTDQEIVEKLLNEKGAAGDKARDLYISGLYQLHFPDDSEDGGDWSGADLSLMSKIEFYCIGPSDEENALQLDRVFSGSALAKREKWTRAGYAENSYRQATIGKAIAHGKEPNAKHWSPNYGKAGRNPGRGYHPSPNGNADRFVDMFGEGVLYRIKGDKGTWLLWNKNIWKPDNTLEIENMGREIPRVLYMEAAQMDEERRKTGVKFALKSDSIASIRAFLDAVKSDRQIARYYRDFDQNPFLVGLPGSEGIILELTETGYRLRQARKEDMVTLACSVLPATREDKREPVEWLKFLDLIFVKMGKDGKVEPDKELIKYIQKVMGYSLLGRQDQQAFFVFYGDGSNGKSTLLRVWALILGLQDYATYPDIETFGKKLSDKEIRSDLAAIMKQRVVFVVEGDRKLKLNITLINRWTGGQEPLTFRDLYERTVSEWPQGTLVTAVNNKPMITDSNYGIWRRVRLVPFLVNLDTTLKEKKVENYADILFEKEGDLIFRWMLQGYEEYKRDGLKSPSSVDEATKQYKSESNSVFLFAGDMLKVEGNGRLMSSELMEKYKEYCIAEELDRIDMKEFREELEKFYDGNILVGNARTNKGIVWRGLKFKDEDDYSLDVLVKENELPE